MRVTTEHLLFPVKKYKLRNGQKIAPKGASRAQPISLQQAARFGGKNEYFFRGSGKLKVGDIKNT